MNNLKRALYYVRHISRHAVSGIVGYEVAKFAQNHGANESSSISLGVVAAVATYDGLGLVDCKVDEFAAELKQRRAEKLEAESDFDDDFDDFFEEDDLFEEEPKAAEKKEDQPKQQETKQEKQSK